MRSFIAITLPEAIVEQLEDLQDGLRGATWSVSETFHITLAFLGDQPRRTLEDLDSHLIALDAPAFDLTLTGVGVFGQTRASRSSPDCTPKWRRPRGRRRSHWRAGVIFRM